MEQAQIDLAHQIKDELHKLVSEFIHETAYQKVHLLSPTSQSICFQMQSNLVNTQHIWGDIFSTDDSAVRRLSIAVSIKNLQTFIEAAAAARELYLILPDHLIDYQDRAEKLIRSMNSMFEPDSN